MPFNSATKNAIAQGVNRLCLQARQGGLPDAIIHAAQRVGLALAERADDDLYLPEVWVSTNLGMTTSLQSIAQAIRIEAGIVPEMTDEQDQRAGALCVAIAEQWFPYEA